MNIFSSTPLRISLFGGGTDMPEYFSKHGSKILSFAIDKFVRVEFRKVPMFSKINYRFIYSKTESLYSFENSNNPVFKNIFSFTKSKKTFGEYIYQSDLPSMSGVGSSSAFTISMLNLLNYIKKIKKIDPYSLSKKAIYFEQKILNEKVGIQDQIACAYGGFNKINISRDGNFQVKKLYNQNKKNIKKLVQSLFLIHTGRYRFASDTEKTKKFNLIDLSYLAQAADEGEKIIKSKKLITDEIGKLLFETWKIKKSISNNVSSPEADYIIETAIKNGANGGKVIGAGNGGFVLLQVPKKYQKKIFKIFAKFLIVKVNCFNKPPQINEIKFD